MAADKTARLPEKKICSAPILRQHNGQWTALALSPDARCRTCAFTRLQLARPVNCYKSRADRYAGDAIALNSGVAPRGALVHDCS